MTGVSEQLLGPKPRNTYITLLRQCITLPEGQKIHAQVAADGYERETLVGNLLVQMYARCGSVECARLSFEQIISKSNFSWSIMLAAYVNHGEDREALKLFQLMDLEGSKADAFIFSSVLNACSNLRALETGKQIHSRIVSTCGELDVALQNALITVYGRCGCLEVSVRLFEGMAKRDIISWNAILLCYTYNEVNDQAWRTYLRMNLEGVRPNIATFLALVGAFADLGAGYGSQGRELHVHVIETGYGGHVVLQNAIISMYSKFHCLENARRVFEEMQEKSPVSWTSILTAYAQHEQGDQALKLFRLMNQEGLPPDEMTFSAVLAACSNSTRADVSEGRKLHARIVSTGYGECNPVVGTALLNMYVDFGCLVEARAVFDELDTKDSVAWNAMLTAYTEADEHRSALEIYWRQRLEGLVPDPASFAIVLVAACSLGESSVLKGVHVEAAARGWETDSTVGTALVCTYAKCGRLEDANAMFEKVAKTSVVVWNTVIGAYAKHGHGKRSVDMFMEMSLEYVQPDAITFNCVLHACSHSGMVQQALEYFMCMSLDYGVGETLEHYVCVVDALARGGMVKEAEELVSSMPYETDHVVWKVLLQAKVK